MPKCKAKSKQSGVRCKRYPSKGRLVCASHGGKSLQGVDSPRFKTGRWSECLPDRLLPKYHAALVDEELTKLDNEIALTDAQLEEQLILLRRDGATPNTWDEAKKAFRSFRTATNRGRRAAALESLNRLDQILGVDSTDATAWAGVNDLIEQRRKLVDTERRRLADEDQAVSIEKLMLMMAAVVDIVRRHVASKEARSAIAGEIRRLIAGPGSPG